MSGIHVIFAGPLKDPNRVRNVHHGELTVTARGLRLRLNDGRTVLVTLDDSTAMLELANKLSSAASNRALTEITSSFMVPPDFIAGKVLP